MKKSGDLTMTRVEVEWLEKGRARRGSVRQKIHKDNGWTDRVKRKDAERQRGCPDRAVPNGRGRRAECRVRSRVYRSGGGGGDAERNFRGA